MDAPQILLDALNSSITSGTFVDTKIYVFSRREASGRVSSPQSLYCNGHVLNTIPYFSTHGFSEGRTKDINGGFPPGADSFPYTDHYDYLSDSDLEDEEPIEHCEQELPSIAQVLGSEARMTPGNPPQPSRGMSEVENRRIRDRVSERMGRVAIVRDIAAVTFEALIYYLYTGEVIFAPFSSDPRRELTTEPRTGNWKAAKPPSPQGDASYSFLASTCDDFAIYPL
ncbi:hypothetical protein BJ322DRAFT_1167035 [Thelephora terrestris]|uniref:Uncharacterized protein n=1 Tax=Thelephora terrestris TaxID=56493 RepID=A0A9P6H5E6_9AGAM|nr:hypothetical protein BJ322DRAFT_1167035 [Thelephora terrestris]